MRTPVFQQQYAYAGQVVRVRIDGTTREYLVLQDGDHPLTRENWADLKTGRVWHFSQVLAQAKASGSRYLVLVVSYADGIEGKVYAIYNPEV